jgi:membrane-associated phospholipid phosphatase
MMLFPLLVVVTDPVPARVNRTLILYLATWVILGNVFATLGSSVGPVFYDRLIGGDRFADLAAMLRSSGMIDSDFGPVQDYLWPAFPSMHVAMAALPALYGVERSVWLAPVAIAYVALVQVISVTSGYHYALDGYVSILCVLLGRAAIEILARQRHRVLAVRQLDLEDALAEMPEGQL